MKTIIKGDLVSSNSDCPEVLQAIPIRYIETDKEDVIEIKVSVKSSCQKLEITVPLKEWNSFVSQVNIEILEISDYDLVEKKD